jgi:hypothetical protein
VHIIKLICIIKEIACRAQKLHVKETKVTKSTRGMPRLSEAMKDVVSCDKLRVEAHTRQSVDFRMGQPTY